MRTFGLFAGIGGLELGLSMGGPFESIGFCEQNLYARAVLAKNWPGVPQYDDVRTLTGHALAADGIGRIDVLTGGWPCQPHSVAGKRANSEDERDLWSEFARLVGETRPRWVVGENVPGVLSSHDAAADRGAGGFFGRVLRDLAALGYDAEWHCYPAAAVGAQHVRERVFLVAHANLAGTWVEASGSRGQARGSANAFQSAVVRQGDWADSSEGIDPGCQIPSHVAYPDSLREPQPEGRVTDERGRAVHGGETPGTLADADSAGPSGRVGQRSGKAQHAHPAYSGTPSWAGGDWGQPSPTTFSAVRGVADGFPGRVDRLRCLGNGVVPQQAAVIGRAITEAEAHFSEFGVMPDQIVQPRHLVAR